MNRDDIIRMAREAGLLDGPVFAQGLERFFHMAQAAEREACAKDLDELSEAAKDLYAKGFVWKAIKESAAVIRARGNQ